MEGGVMYIAGIDVGGTNTDAALIRDGVVVATAKVPTDHAHLVESTMAALEAVLNGHGKGEPFQLHLSTTLSTNAIIEDQGDPVAVLAIPGPGMRIEQLGLGFPVELLRGSIDHRGREVAGLNPVEIQQRLRNAHREGYMALAVVGKFSHRNPVHELEIEGMAKVHDQDFRHITLGHRLSGRPNFPRRLATSYLNASVAGQQAQFVDMVDNLIIQGRNISSVYLLKADGGTMTLKDSLIRPVETILSGPAASIMGAQALMMHEGANAVIVDIGGTTTDIAVQVGGEAVFQRQGAEIAHHKTLVPALFARSMGLGGDSEVRVVEHRQHHEDQGEGGERRWQLAIGPRRAGVPAALGGTKVTPTDAAVALGLASLGDATRARQAVAGLGEALGLDMEAMAKAIVDAFNRQLIEAILGVYRDLEARPVYTVSELLAPENIRPQVIVGLGGPAEVFIPLVARSMDIPWEILPHHKEANAVGAAASRPTAAVTLHADTALATMTVPEMDYVGKIPRPLFFDLKKARAEATRWAASKGAELGVTELDDIVIMEEESFNLVRGFYTTGRIFTIRAQVRPSVRRIGVPSSQDESGQSIPSGKDDPHGSN